MEPDAVLILAHRMPALRLMSDVAPGMARSRLFAGQVLELGREHAVEHGYSRVEERVEVHDPI
jgi:hypothetical protein